LKKKLSPQDHKEREAKTECPPRKSSHVGGPLTKRNTQGEKATYGGKKILSRTNGIKSVLSMGKNGSKKESLVGNLGKTGKRQTNFVGWRKRSKEK